jgi:hypothetical protein
MGPQTYNNIGNEIYPTANRLLKSEGNEHVGDSIVSETGGGIGVSGSLSVTGSMFITGTNIDAKVNNACFQGNVCVGGDFSVGGADTYLGSLNINAALIGGPASLITFKPKCNQSVNTSYDFNINPSGGAYGRFTITNTDPGINQVMLNLGAASLSEDSYINSPQNGVQLRTNNNTRLNISSTGIATFSCQVCTPTTIGGDGYFTSLQSCNSSDPGIEFYRNTCNNNVGIGRLYWYGLNSSYTKTLYSYIQTGIENCGASTFCSRLEFLTACNGSVNRSFMVNGIGVGCFAGTVCAPRFTANVGGCGCIAFFSANGNIVFDNASISAIGNMGSNASQFSVSSRGCLTFRVGENGDPSAAPLRFLMNTNGIACFACQVCTPSVLFNTVGTSTLVNTNITATTCFGATSRSGFTGLIDNCNGVYFGMGADGSGISAGLGFFRESTGWNSALAFYTNCITDGITVPRIQEKMRITSGGNVGINETAPSSMLHFSRQTIWGTSDNRVININNTGTGGDISQPHNMGSITWYSGNNTPTAEIAAYRNTPASGNNIELRFLTATAGTPLERMRIMSTGCVGIGNTSPNTMLHTTIQTCWSTNGTVANSYPVATFSQCDCSGGARGLQIGVPTGGISSPVFLKVVNTGARFSILNESNVENFTISGGRVGIQNCSPAATLHVGGTAGDTAIFICSTCKTSNPTFLRLIGVNSNDVTTQMQIVHRGNHSNGGFTDRIDFSVNNGTAWCERVIRLDFNGNVGMCEGSLSVKNDICTPRLNLTSSITLGGTGGASSEGFKKFINFGSAFDNPTINVICVGNPQNSVTIIRVTVFTTGFGSSTANVHTGYAMKSWTASYACPMSVVAGFGNNNVGTLAWSGDYLQYTANRVSNYDSYHMEVEYGGSNGSMNAVFPS